MVVFCDAGLYPQKRKVLSFSIVYRKRGCCFNSLRGAFSVYLFFLQEEYEREKIEWNFIEFPDNKDCIELIDKKPSGIIPTLDEQVREG